LVDHNVLDKEPGAAKLIRSSVKDQHATEPGSMATRMLGIHCGNGEKKERGLVGI
jgi:hypothetical protein